MDSKHMAKMQKMHGMMKQMMAMMDDMMGGEDSMGEPEDMRTMRAMNVDMSDPKARAVYAREKMRMK